MGFGEDDRRIHPPEYASSKQLPRFDFVILENEKSVQRLLNLPHPVLGPLRKGLVIVLIQNAA